MDDHAVDSSGFERRILRFSCLVGIVRMLIELYSNYTRAVSEYVWVMDTTLLAIIVVAFAFSFTRLDFRFIVIPLSLLVIMLLSISWINTGGVYGKSEYNYFGLVIGLALINSGKRLIWMLGLSFAILLIMVLIWEFKFEWISAYVRTFSKIPLHFIAIVLVGTFFVYYLRYLFDRDRKNLQSQQLELSRRSMELDMENAKLISQQKEYEEMNGRLETEIKDRRMKLESQNKSLREFIEVSLQEFYPPLNNTLKSINDLKKTSKNQSENMHMLVNSGYSLEKAYEGMKSKMKKNLR